MQRHISWAWFLALALVGTLWLGGCNQTEPPKPTAAEADLQLDKELTEPGKAAEARAWCAATNHGGFKMSKSEMLKLAEDAYAAGAARVWVAGIEKIRDAEISAELVVQLPQDAALRQKLLAWHATIAPMLDVEPATDQGQRYIDLNLD